MDWNISNWIKSNFDEKSLTINSIDLDRLVNFNPFQTDQQYGVCSIPLYEFDDIEIDELNSRQDPGRARDIFMRYGIFQYFFPPADQLALGLADYGIKSKSTILNRIERISREGHPLGSFEILDQKTQIPDLVAALQERKLIVEGEVGLEVSTEGNSYRSQVKFRPREGIFEKIARIFSIKGNFTLSDLFK